MNDHALVNMDCAHVDELSAAYAVGALDADEERAVSAHLAACVAPHDELRAHVDAAGVLTAALAPVTPSSALRDRLMATIARTTQDHRPPMAVPASRPAVAEPVATEARLPWWRAWPSPLALAGVAAALVIGLGAWSYSLNNQLTARNDALRTIATADAIHRATGSAGSGWVVESGGETLFVAAELATLPAGSIYELWLIEADGTPVAVGAMDQSADFAVVPLERSLGTATTFALTVETGRVEEPTSEPVLVAPLDA